MKILFSCSDSPDIARNRFHRDFLRKRFAYEECVSRAKRYPLRIAKIMACIPWKIFKSDVVFLSYMGHFLVLYVRLFTSKPIVFDFYLSIYDMLCNDRKIFSPDSLMGRFVYWIEKRSLQQADYIIVDTQKLIDSLSKTYGISPSKFVRVPLTINEQAVYPIQTPRYKEPFCVLYVGSYIPLHGTPLIIEAARILQEQNETVHFLMIGQGPDYERCRSLAKQYGLHHIDFKGFMPIDELNRYYNACDINLGLFNTGDRANSVILNKTNDAFRVGKPHLTLRTDAMQELFENNVTIFFIEENTPEALARRIVELKNNPELVRRVGRNALKVYDKLLSNQTAERIMETSIFLPLQQRLNRV